MDSSAFSRVRSFLRYARPARWTAILCGISTAILYAVLILLLALFTDLLVTRGRIPTFAQLPAAEQERALADWKALPEEDRERALQRVGFAEFASRPERPAALSPDAQARWQTYRSLVGGEGIELPPPLATASRDDLQNWANKRGLRHQDPYLFAAAEHEWRWRAYVWHVLNDRVSEDAANAWLPPAPG